MEYKRTRWSVENLNWFPSQISFRFFPGLKYPIR